MDRNEAYLEVEERMLLVRILVSHMCMLSGEENLNPSKNLKEQLAQAIVQMFPCLAVSVPEGSQLTNHTHFYNSKLTNGFIDTRLKTMRTNLRPKKEKNGNKDNLRPAKKAKHGNRRLDNDLHCENGDSPLNEEEFKFKVIIYL